MNKVTSLFLIVLFGINFVEMKRPDYVQKCVAGNKKCMLENMNKIFSTKYAGDPIFGLVELDPIDLHVIDIKADPKNPVKVDLNFKNTKLLGGKNMKATKVKGFGKNPTGHHDILLEGPFLTILGNYKANGQVLILPVRGDGNANITMIQPKLKISIEGAESTKNGELYMDVKSTTLDMNCEKIEMNFSNLFNGDKALGDHFNEFINQNWREIFMDIKKPFFSEINKSLYATIQQVFNKTPYTELFEN